MDEAGKASGDYAYGLAGTKGFFLSGIESSAAHPGALAFFFFMMALIDQSGSHPGWGDGRKVAVEELLPLWLWSCCHSHSTRIGFGRRMAGPHRAQLRLGHGVVDFSEPA